jgi:hypothetical protein
MTTEWTGPQATRGDGTPPQRCVTANRPASQPSLPAMTRKAIELLEGATATLLPAGRGRLDRQAGPRRQRVRADRRADRLRQRDRGRAGVRAPAARHADRRHRRSRPHEPDRGEDSSGTGNPTGYSNSLVTADDQVMRVTYGTAGGATPPAAPPSQQHTGSVVPIWAQGPGAAAVLGTNDHTDLFEVLSGGRRR